jgi:uncharacterized membrane protein YfcA
VKYLQTLVKQERSHGQWKKQGLNLICLAILILRSLARNGSLGFKMVKCSWVDWTISAVFITLMAILVVVATKLSSKEQHMKEKYDNINLVPSDLVFKGTVLRKVLAMGFGGGWVAGALGLGGGVIYNPMLLQMGVPP